jgi:NAD+ synthase
MIPTINPEEAAIVIKDFIKTYVNQSGTNGIVLGLSGGIDSAVVALLATQALGRNHVHCLFMPDAATPDDDRRHQKLITTKYKIPNTTIDITPITDTYTTILGRQPEKKCFANIKARARMILLFTHANQNNLLVCGTSNKSEMLVGYFTKYGDGGVDIQPIGDLYKTQIFQLAKHLGIPKPIIAKPPTAGLWIGQTDEGELKMKYETLDQILLGLECKLPTPSIMRDAHATKAQVERIRKMRAHCQHKRRFPLIPKLGIRTPGLDWRSPVQEG